MKVQGCPKTRGKKGGRRNGEEGSKRERGRFTYLQTKGRVMRHWKKIYKQDIQTYTDNREHNIRTGDTDRYTFSGGTGTDRRNKNYRQWKTDTDKENRRCKIGTGTDRRDRQYRQWDSTYRQERQTVQTMGQHIQTGETDNTDNGTTHTDRRDRQYRQWDNTYRQERQAVQTIGQHIQTGETEEEEEQTPLEGTKTCKHIQVVVQEETCTDKRRDRQYRQRKNRDRQGR